VSSLENPVSQHIFIKKPMKKTQVIMSAFLCIMLFSCKREERHKEVAFKIDQGAKFRSELVYSDSMANTFRELLKDQSVCAASGSDTCAVDEVGSTTGDCSKDFCGEDKCRVKILCCHRINESIFDAMTGNKTCGFADFPWEEIDDVFQATNCEKELVRIVRVLKPDGYWYVVSDQPYSDTTINDGTWKAYYSAPMIEGLLNASRNAKIHVYKGGVISTTEHLLPILVDFGHGKPDAYYNLSNDIP
jgi:hypothetical protein